jgi:uncharacterized membrane protein
MIEKKRHLVKSITWRLVASITTFVIGWYTTGNMELGMTIGLFDFFVKLVLYYYHERIWYKSKYGIKNE